MKRVTTILGLVVIAGCVSSSQRSAVTNEKDAPIRPATSKSAEGKGHRPDTATKASPARKDQRLTWDLDLSSNKIYDDDLIRIGKRTHLKSLDLWGCQRFSDVGLTHLANLKNLTRLRLGDCVPLSGAGFAAFEGHKSLKWLSLNYCYKLTNEGLAQIAKLTNLTYLDISYCYIHLTDEGLRHLENLKMLKTLDVSACRFTEEGLQRLRRKLPGCKIINNRPAWWSLNKGNGGPKG